MKKIIVSLIFCLVLTGNSFAADGVMSWEGPIAGTLAASGVDKTTIFRLDTFKPAGFFSIQAVTTGSGTLTITYQVSNVTTNPIEADWVSPTGITAIATSQAAGSGFYQWPVAGEVIFAKWIRLILTETTGTDGLSYTLYPNVQ